GPAVGQRRIRGRVRDADDRRHRALRPRLRRAAPRRRGRPRRADRVPRLMATLGPQDGTLTVQTGRKGAASKAGHDLTLEVTRWQATLELGDSPSLTLNADARSFKVLQ